MRTSSIGSVAAAQSGDLCALMAEEVPGADATAGSYATGSLSALLGHDLSSAGSGGFVTRTIASGDYTGVGAALEFSVDGNEVVLNGNYANAGAVAAALGTALGPDYNVSEDTGVITITSTTSAAAVEITDANAAAVSAGATNGAGTVGSVGTVGFQVDGHAVALDGIYATLADVVAKVQADLDGAAADTYTVSVAGTGISIEKIATGVTSTAPVIASVTGVGSAPIAAGTSHAGADATPGTPAVTLDLADGDFTVQIGTRAAVSVIGTFESAEDLVSEINARLTGAIASLDENGTMTITSSEEITVGGNEAATLGYTPGEYLTSGSLANATVGSQEGANATIMGIDSALTSVNNLRSTFGAIQNRFESTIANLSAVSENLSAARSRILDADFAAETARMTSAQILQQAGVSILAQANSLPQMALSLLQ
jgi:flagellin